MIFRKNLNFRIQRKLNLIIIVEFSTAQKVKKANRTDKLLKNLRKQTLNNENSEYLMKDDLLYRKN